jgi:hypothetical protein
MHAQSLLVPLECILVGLTIFRNLVRRLWRARLPPRKDGALLILVSRRGLNHLFGMS